MDIQLFMPQITILNLSGLTIQTADSYRPILYQIHAAGQDWMHACGGKGRCTTCKCIVASGMENISPPSAPEQRYQAQGALKNDERLACQAIAHGDVEIVVPELSKLPHLTYSF